MMSVSFIKNLFANSIVLLLLISMAPNSVYAEANVTATFRIDSQFFKSILSAEAVSEVEFSVAQSLSKQAKSRFPFLIWQAADSNPTSGPQLVLRMIDVPNGACHPTPTIKLRWYGVVAAGERALSNVGQHELYQTCDPNIPTQEPVRLQQEIVAAVSSMLINQDTQKKILMQVLARVPFGNEIINHENQSLLLPFASSDLQAGEDSKIVAKFNFLRENGDPLSSEIKMSPRDGPDGNVKVLVLEINGRELSADSPGSLTMLDETLIQLLAKSADMQIFMKEYVADPFAGETIDEP